MPPWGIGLVRISKVRLPPVELFLESFIDDGELHQPVGDDFVDIARPKVTALCAGAQDSL